MKLLVNLRGVPADEADEMRAILEEHAIDYYETGAGLFGISQPAIWLADDHQAQTAAALLEAHHTDYQQRVRDHQERLRREGRQRTFIKLLGEAPLRFVGYLLVIGVVLYFSIQPFFDFFR